MQTPKSDIFVAMLGIALGAILLGCLLLILLLNKYNFELKATQLPQPPTAVAWALENSHQSENLPTVHL